MACNIACIVVYWVDDRKFQDVVSCFANASLPCVLGSHLLFNLIEASEKNVYGGTHIPLGTDELPISVGSMKFA